MVVSARGGSQGLPGKNIRPMVGRPLIRWSIDAGLAARCATRVVVTTDDPEIAEVARRAGAEVPFLRPAVLAGPDVSGVDPVIHLVEAVGATEPWICLLQPTSPLRTHEDIDAARSLAVDGVDAVLAVTAVRQHARWQRKVGMGGYLEKAFGDAPATRQELESAWCPNGAIYLCRRAVLLSERTLTPTRTVPYAMPGSRSIDIDTLDDFVVAECLLSGLCP